MQIKKYEENSATWEEIQTEDPPPDLVATEFEYNQMDAETCEDSSQCNRIIDLIENEIE